MAKRRKMSKRTNKRVFRRGAAVKKKNLRARPMRGGFRI